MKKRNLLKLFTAVSIIAACDSYIPPSDKGATMRSLEDLEQHLAFTCVHEIKPPLSPDTQKLYNYALYQDLHNMWLGTEGDAVWQNAAVYYRIAAASGDYKANIRLQYLLQSGRVTAQNPKDEVYNLNRQLEKQLPATAYYNLYGYLTKGYGVKTAKKEGRFAYLRKAADMGSREAQYELSEILGSIQDKATFKLRDTLRGQLLSCSSEQGLGEASLSLGIFFKIDKEYSRAVKAFHQGVKNGNAQSARRLAHGFDKKTTADNEIDYLALKPDAERQIRYKMIAQYLGRQDYLQPKVPDLDKIVPLPPAKLPPWDGKIEFQRWYEGASPPKPSDELVQRLAEQAGLDWQTGLPLK